jgi:fluoroquinolone resistance protein
MNNTFIADQDFHGIRSSHDTIPMGDYENCTFNNCIFSDSDLSGMNFIECKFTDCDFSLAKLVNSSFRDVKFYGCKLLGLHFDDCNKTGLSAEFANCQLDLSSFYKLNLRNIILKNCNLKEVDFSESNLTNLALENCDLTGAIFKNTILVKTDFRTSYNYSIDPEINRISKAKFSINGVVGLLGKYNIEIE